MKAKWLAAAAATALILGPVQPATAQTAGAAAAPRALAASDVRSAQAQHQQVLDQFGGAMEGPLANYVAGVGARISGQTRIADPQSSFRITTLNSPVRNAFAVPGGYVYITRDLIALMNSEDELAFVLGHEMGHVSARHGQKRQSRSNIGAIGAVLAQVLTGSDTVGQLAGQVEKQMVLGYSRAQENGADSLGVRYIAGSSYDPFAAPRMLSAMGSAETLDAKLAGRTARASSWGSTHPLSVERVRRTTALATQTGLHPTPSRERFLAAIDGMPFGDDPRQGMVEGQRFIHPALRFQFTAPAGYTITNGAQSVTVVGTGGQAQFAAGKLAGSLEDHVGQVFRALAGGSSGQISLPAPRTTTINGIPVAYATTRANSNRGQLDVSVVAYRWDAGTAYHFVLLTPAGAGFGPFDGMLRSLGPLSASEAAAVRGREIDVVTVARGDTVRSLASRMAYSDNQLDRFLTLNGLDTNAVLEPGQKVKLVVFSR